MLLVYGYKKGKSSARMLGILDFYNVIYCGSGVLACSKDVLFEYEDNTILGMERCGNQVWTIISNTWDFVNG
jgi:hypothetical protein